MEVACLVVVGMPKSNDMLFASWEWRVVRVALSLKASEVAS